MSDPLLPPRPGGSRQPSAQPSAAEPSALRAPEAPEAAAPTPAAPTPPPLAPVLAQVRADAAVGRFAVWGRSTLIDEFTGVPSIPRELFDALHAAAGIPAAFPVGNAGLLHVYGYWFSAVPTPFGFKRDRWRDGALARALGKPADAFLLFGHGTTALERVTAAALPVLRTPPAAALQAEAIIATPAGPRPSRVVLRRADPAGPAALVYGIAGASGPLELVTAFPLAGDPEPLLGDFAAEPRPRWNAVADS